MSDEEGSIVKKAAEEQQQLDNQPAPAPTTAPTADPIYDPVTKTMKAPGMNGGFFVGSMPTPSTPQPQQQGRSSPQSITDIQQKMAALQAELNAYQQQGTAPTPPTTIPAREPPKSPMFGVDIPQQAATSPATPRQPSPPAQTPQQKPREPMKTPMFGAYAAPVETEQQQAPTPQPQQQPAPAASSQSTGLTIGPDGQPIQPDAKVGENPNVSPYGYIAYSTDGKGFALIMDHLTQKDIDYFSFMSNYLHETYPKSMPNAHPAMMMKFAANHLLVDIRKALADKVVCRQCNTEMPANTIQCPKCKTYNRCPQCHNFVGGSFLYI